MEEEIKTMIDMLIILMVKPSDQIYHGSGAPELCEEFQLNQIEGRGERLVLPDWGLPSPGLF